VLLRTAPLNIYRTIVFQQPYHHGPTMEKHPIDQIEAKPKAKKPFKFPGTAETAAEQQPIIPEEQCNHVFLTCSPITGQIYSDQPGQFPCRSTSGMSYMMVAHDYDSNAIVAIPMPSHTSASLLTAYKEVHRILTSRAFRPQYQRLDNEISKEFKEFLIEISLSIYVQCTRYLIIRRSLKMFAGLHLRSDKRL
jgi:hypothetical protein